MQTTATRKDRFDAEPNWRTRPARYLGSRKVKHEDGTRSKVATSALYTQIERFHGSAAGWKPQGLLDTDGDTWVTEFVAVVPCDHCPGISERHGGHKVRLDPVAGTYNPEKVCNARCMGATGPSCECACGGENHGGTWAWA